MSANESDERDLFREAYGQTVDEVMREYGESHVPRDDADEAVRKIQKTLDEWDKIDEAAWKKEFEKRALMATVVCAVVALVAIVVRVFYYG
ncbi:MAG: hypothetical protein HUK22_06940 [Thermoguttaceae bacterium]|nr:hypothetical protein [Thermoguttaceae bacterium]